MHRTTLVFWYHPGSGCAVGINAEEAQKQFPNLKIDLNRKTWTLEGVSAEFETTIENSDSCAIGLYDKTEPGYSKKMAEIIMQTFRRDRVHSL